MSSPATFTDDSSQMFVKGRSRFTHVHHTWTLSNTAYKSYGNGSPSATLFPRVYKLQ